jgi:hypothetical protein
MARNAVVIVLVVVTATYAAAQATAFTFSRFGRNPFSDAELAQIAELVVSTGKRPWLLRSPVAMIPDVRVASLFLEPDVPGQRVQRGRMLSLAAEGPQFVPARSPWRIQGAHLYAHVPVPGQRSDEVRGDDDVGWPFVLQGEFDDDTLISIVEFVRSQPPIPFPAFLRQIPAAPISGIQRRDDAIVVGFRRSDSEGDAVWMVRKDGQWVITRSESSIA